MNGVVIKDRGASATAAVAPSQGERAVGAIVKHVVMWNVRADTPDQRADGIARIKAGFEALRGRIPGMLAIEIGVDGSGVDYACDVVLYSEFESQAALDDYATHPAHLALRDSLEGVRIARHQVDYRAQPAR